jgi:Ca-activated chloride channel family protein
MTATFTCPERFEPKDSLALNDPPGLRSAAAADWITWKSYDPFCANVLCDLLPHTQHGEATLEYDSASGDLLAEYRLPVHVTGPAPLPAVFAFRPDGFQKPVELKKTAPSYFRGKVAIGERRGLFRVRPLADSAAFPEVGLYRPEGEKPSPYAATPRSYSIKI